MIDNAYLYIQNRVGEILLYFYVNFYKRHANFNESLRKFNFMVK